MPGTSEQRLQTIINSRDDLPDFDVIVSRPGILDIPEEHMDDVVLLGRCDDLDLDLSIDSLKAGATAIEVFWLVSPTFRDSLHFRSIQERIRKYPALSSASPAFRLATPEVIRSLHEEVQKQRGDELTQQMVTETISLFKRIAYDAYAMGASDVHIHVERDRAYINVRVDGEIRKFQDLRSTEFGMAFVRTLYQSMADETSRSKQTFDPRDYAEARIEVVVNDVRLSFRYQHSPIAPEGINVVMRLIVESDGQTATIVQRAALGYDKSHDQDMARMFSRSTGLVIVCGIVGSGKSTTLRNEVMMIVRDRPGICVRTIEDPVEYIIPGTSQIPVVRNPDDNAESKRNSPFNRALKACLRMDNNVIMMGEIRDMETAEIVVDAVLTGHQILTTLHTASALEAIPRLRKLGVDAQTLGLRTFISGLIYQRLLPKLCPKCRVPLSRRLNREKGVNQDLLRRIYHAVGSEHYRRGQFFLRGHGCDECKETGIIGRTACAETVVPNEAMRAAWAENKDRLAEKIWRRQWTPSWREFVGKTSFEHAVSRMLEGSVSPLDIEHAYHPLDAAPGFDRMQQAFNAMRRRTLL